MEANGYRLKIENVESLAEIKAQYNVPANLQSCHTAIVDGYIIEGHVPFAEVETTDGSIESSTDVVLRADLGRSRIGWRSP